MQVRPTALGWKGVVFYGVILLSYHATPYSNLFFLLLAFLSVLALAAPLATARNLRGVTAEVAPVAAVPVGSDAVVAARVDPAGRPRAALELDVQMAGGWRRIAGAAHVDRPGTLRGTLSGLPRGIHRIEAAAVESVHPLGLLRARRLLPVTGDVVVHPAPAPLAELAAGGLVGAAGATHGDDAAPSTLRPWRETDGLRGVHWRATARRGELVVAEREAEVGEGLEVVLDRRLEDDALERALSVAAALIQAAGERKEPLRLHSQGLVATFGPGHRPSEEALRFLAGAESLPSDAPPPPAAPTGAVRLPLEVRGA